MNRVIDKIIIHCADTFAHMDIGAADIRKWHTDPKPKGNGWSDIGYHFVIRRNGEVEKGRALEVKGAHCYGQNANSIGICMAGGKGKDMRAECNFTREQWAALGGLVDRLVIQYPGAEIYGHNEFSNKECPTFDVRSWWQR